MLLPPSKTTATAAIETALATLLAAEAATLLTTLALSACGGGDRAEEYQPKAMLVFGDEHSAFTTITVGSAEGTST